MVNQYYVTHISVLLHPGHLFDGKIEETGKQPKRSEPIQVKLKIFQESNNHGSANTKISCKQLKT
jgi:hypothetical protein